MPRMRNLALASVSLVTFAASQTLAQATGGELRHFPTPLTASREQPYDVDADRIRKLDADGKTEAAQREFDILSWQSFLALNWTADRDGKPDPAKSLTDGKADPVWSMWRPSRAIFLPDGARPAPWGAPATNATAIDLFRAKAAWRQHVSAADENFQAFSGPLVDQNGKWVRYEVLVNREEFDYIVRNSLYSQDGQAAFSARAAGNRVEFPASDAAAKRRGAIEIKLAWKELDARDDRSRFLVRHVRATLAEPAKPGQNGPQTREYDAGLVGMHISMRTRSSPEWVWATFEQVDNVRRNKTEDGKTAGPNFANPDGAGPVNELPKRNAVIDPATGSPVPAPAGTTATTWIESLTTQPVQVTRVVVPKQSGLNDLDDKLTAGTNALNAEVQAMLRQAKSVFQYYELIGTQWPLRPSAPAIPGGAGSAPDSIRQKTPGMMVPVFLVNTTMETYFQKGSQPAGPLEQDDRLADGAPPIDATPVNGTESCVGCHYSAGITIGFKRHEDGTFKVVDGHKVPIIGENANFGQTGNAHFSWLLQLEAQGERVATGGAAGHAAPATMLDIKRQKSLTGQ